MAVFGYQTRQKLFRFFVFLILPLVLAHVWVGNRFHFIVIHHSASEGGNYRSIRRAHWTRGWSDAAYHVIIDPTNRVESSWRFKFLGWSPGTQNPKMNFLGLHVCMVGNFENRFMTEHERRNLAQTVKGIQKAYGIADSQIRLHRECSSTLCPGKHIQKQKILAGLNEVKGTSFLGIKYLQMGFIFATYHLFFWIWRRLKRKKTV